MVMMMHDGGGGLDSPPMNLMAEMSCINDNDDDDDTN